MRPFDVATRKYTNKHYNGTLLTTKIDPASEVHQLCFSVLLKPSRLQACCLIHGANSSFARGAIILPNLKSPHNAILFPRHPNEVIWASFYRVRNTVVANLCIVHSKRPRSGVVDAIRVEMIEVDTEIVVTPGVFTDVRFLCVLPHVAWFENGDRWRGVAECGDAA